jgi:energy-coupling factor transporter transmembrane protein EcfT
MKITSLKLDFWAKIISILIFLPLSAFLVQPKFLIFSLIALAVIFLALKISFRSFLQQSKNYIIPLTIGLMVLSLIFTPGDITSRLMVGTLLSIRFTLLISFGIIFSMITNPTEFPSGFIRVGVPHKYGVTLMVGYRMMPLISEKISAIVSAQKARGTSFRFSLSKTRLLFKQLLSLIIPVLHATLEMSVRLSDALISRGYDPDGKISYPTNKWSLYDYGLTFISLFVFGLSLVK